MVEDVMVDEGVKSLEVASIRTDGGTQARAGLDVGTVSEYEEAMLAGDAFPPVVVFYDGETYWLADGFHRIAAAKRASRLLFKAEVKQGTRRDAVLHAAGANAQHGLRRTNADKRRAVEALLTDEEWSEWSDREIARRCKVSQPFVSKMRKELDTDNGYQYDRKFVHPKTGEATTMDTSNIGANGQKDVEEVPEPEPAYVEVWELEGGVRSYLDAYGDLFGGIEIDVEKRIEILTGMKRHGYGHLLSSGSLPEPYRKRDVKQAVNNVLDQLRQKEREETVVPHEGQSAEEMPGKGWEPFNPQSGWQCSGCRWWLPPGTRWGTYRNVEDGRLLCGRCMEKGVGVDERRPAPPLDYAPWNGEKCPNCGERTGRVWEPSDYQHLEAIRWQAEHEKVLEEWADADFEGERPSAARLRDHWSRFTTGRCECGALFWHDFVEPWAHFFKVPEETVESEDEVEPTPEQVMAEGGKLDVHFSSERDEWETPQWLFDLLDEEFGFELDVCALPDSAKCETYFSPKDDGLAQEWGTRTCWMNPPYGRGLPIWLGKAYDSAKAGGLAVCLVPARTDTRWWWDYVIQGEVRFLKGRLVFGSDAYWEWRWTNPPGMPKIDEGKKQSAPFPSAVVVFWPGVPAEKKKVVWWEVGPGTGEEGELSDDV